MKRHLLNLSIFAYLLLGIRNIYFALPFNYYDLDEEILSHTFNLSMLAIHHTLYLVKGILMVIVAFYLGRRQRVAYVLALISLIASLTGHLSHIHPLTLPFVLLDAAMLVILLLESKHFRRKSQPQNIKNAFIYLIFAALVYIGFIVTGLIRLQSHLSKTASLAETVIESGKALFFMDNALFVTHSFTSLLFERTMIGAFWCLIGLSLIAVLRPLILYPVLSRNEKNKARSLVVNYGENPTSYLALESDKLYFFTKDDQGVCAYTTVGNVMTLCGDIICSDEKAEEMIKELLVFADLNHYDILMMNVTDRFKTLYEKYGFGFTKCGEDACFELSTYDLKGGAVAKVRAAINHATKAGITVLELNPQSDNAQSVIGQLKAITDEWLKSKNSPELVFMLGKNNFEDPMDRRYFYAEDPEGKILAYCVFNPYNDKKGYIAEITRRRQDAPQGALEKIIYEAFMTFKSEGVIEGTMGLSPLYNVDSENNSQITPKLFNYIYDNMTSFYNFKALHHAKEKYAPTHWKTRYYAYLPGTFSPKYAYAIVRSQVPGKLITLALDSVKGYLTGKWSKDEH